MWDFKWLHGTKKISHEQKLAELESTISKMYRQMDAERRIKAEYWDIIEQIHVDRDAWKERFFEQSRQHHAAQVALVNALVQSRQMVEKLQSAINEDRVKAGLPPIKVSEDPVAPPVGVQDVYAAQMAKMGNSDVYDAMKDRDSITQTSQSPNSSNTMERHPV